MRPTIASKPNTSPGAATLSRMVSHSMSSSQSSSCCFSFSISSVLSWKLRLVNCQILQLCSSFCGPYCKCIQYFLLSHYSRIQLWFNQLNLNRLQYLVGVMVCVRDSRITFIVLIMIVITWSWTVTRICVNNISRNVDGNTSILGQPTKIIL